MGHRLRYRDVLAIREFRAIWIAELLSVAGDQLARVALAVLVYERTDSATLTALTYALTFAPAVLGGVVLSGVADRWPRRTVLVSTDLVRAGLAGLMAVPVLPLPVLLVVVGVLTMASAPAKASQLSMLPQILQGEQYPKGLALRSITSQAAQAVGFFGGGAVLVVLSPHVALAVNAATFVVAAIVVAFGVDQRPAAASAAPDGKPERAAVVMWRHRRVRGLIGLSWLVGFFVVPEGLAAPYADSLGSLAFAVGVLMAADPIGSILGVWVVARLPPQTRERLIVPLAVAAGLPLLACWWQPGLLVTAVLWGLSGACSSAYLVQAQVAFTLLVPDHRRGAVGGMATAGLYASQGFVIFGAGVLADALGPVSTVALAGAVGGVLAGLVGVLWLRARGGSEGGGREADVAVRSPCSSSPAPPPTEPAVDDPGESVSARQTLSRLPRTRAWTYGVSST